MAPANRNRPSNGRSAARGRSMTVLLVLLALILAAGIIAFPAETSMLIAGAGS